MTKKKNLRIRNSTAEFLIFSKQAGENSIKGRVEDKTVWLTQKTERTLGQHLSAGAGDFGVKSV
jgi:hypothetical protein